MLIINSDDFGLSPQVNKAIFEAYQAKLISSTTTLVNFDEGFRDAKRYIGEGKIPNSAIGIHFNLTQGVPLTTNILKMSRFCNDGHFATKRSNPIFSLTSTEKKAIAEELEAQFNHFKENFGFMPSHIDSHHHIHTEWAILNQIIKLAKRNGIRAVRIARNTGKTNSTIRHLYRKLINSQIRLSGLKTVDYFGDISDFNVLGLKQNKKQEIMVHALFEKDRLVDLDKQELKKRVNSLLNNSGIKLNSYSDLLNVNKS